MFICTNDTINAISYYDIYKRNFSNPRYTYTNLYLLTDYIMRNEHIKTNMNESCFCTYNTIE